MPATPGREPDAIDIDVAPSRRAGLVTWPIEDESVIVNLQTRQTTVMNGFASMIWGCLDGQATLRDLISDVAYAFDVPAEEVTKHVLMFGRDIGRAGLLDGVGPRAEPGHLGVPCGQKLSGFETRPADPHLARVLIVNWNPSCEYCVVVAPELASISPALRRAGVELVLHRADNADPFSGMGTPVAYLVEADGTVLDLAMGAVEVARLARRTSGQPEPAPTATVAGDPGAKYISTPPLAGVCGPAARAARRRVRTWEPTSVYRVDDFCVGLRADSEAADHLVGQALAAYRVAVRRTPPVHLSVVLPEGDGSGGSSFNLLLAGNDTVIRSRSPRRVLRGVAAYLSMLVADEAGTLAPPGIWGVSALPAICGNGAVLLPGAIRRVLAAAQPRLARAGFRLVDMPVALIDPVIGDLVVPQPRVEIDETALDIAPEPVLGPGEGAWVAPGRYPLVAWALGPTPDRAETFTAAGAVATAWTLCVNPPGSPEATMTVLDNLFHRVPALGVPDVALGAMIDDLRRRVATLRGPLSKANSVSPVGT